MLTSAISSDGYEVGQHPLVTRLIKGARPPQPRYIATRDVATVTRYLETLGKIDEISINDLTQKIVMLLALTRPSRSIDLMGLSLDRRRYIPEGVMFVPTKTIHTDKKIALYFPLK